MAKKEGKKTRIGKTSSKVSRDTERLNSILIENFVSLQKALTNLATKFDSLSDNISKLLQLFEISARSFAEKLATTTPDIEKDREFLDKLNRLLEQNKVIAKGLTLMEEKMRERLYGSPQPRAIRPVLSYPAPQSNYSETSEGYIPSSLGSKEKKTREL